MKLISEPVFRRPQNRAVDVYFDAESLGLEPEPAVTVAAADPAAEVIVSTVQISTTEIASVERIDQPAEVEEPQVEPPPDSPPAMERGTAPASRPEGTSQRPGNPAQDSGKSGRHRRGGRHRHRPQRPPQG
jgi:hypothetical protein